MGCGHCEQYGKGPETFHFWNVAFDVDMAIALAEGKPICEADTDCFRQIVAYPPIEGKMYVMRISVNAEHLDHVSMEKPIIIVPKPKRLGDNEMVIDGHHRIARAIRDGIKTLKCVVLTVEEMNSILYPVDMRDGSRETKAILRKRAKEAKKGETQCQS
jgi:hypothetical protein